MRDAAEKAVKVFQDWAVGVDYREDVYKAVKAYADTKPKLEGEDALLLEHTLRDYRRAGLALPPEKRAEVEKLRKELAKLETDFQANIVAVKAPVVFTKAELEGVPDSILESPGVKTGDDSYTMLANVTFHYNTVEETAKKEETRKHLYEVRFNLAREKNVPVLNDILAHRNQIALKLGYKSWDDFQTEIKMAKSGAAAKTFINDLIAGIQPKFDAEVAELRKLKVAETKDPNAQINKWDWRYFANQLKKEKYTVDTEALRVYFPFQRTLDGMFNIYQSIFGLKFTKIIAPEKWVDDLAALHGDRRGQRPTARHVLSRHVPARREVQSLRPIRDHSGQVVARRKIPASDERAHLQLPAARQRTSRRSSVTRMSRRFSTNSATLSTPSSRRPSMCASPAPASRPISSKRPRKCCKTGFGTRRCSTLSRRITAIRPRKFRRR